jgi:hypothetical protein
MGGVSTGDVGSGLSVTELSVVSGDGGVLLGDGYVKAVTSVSSASKSALRVR